MREFQLDRKLSNLVSGKRVVLVGPSPHLVGKHQGKFIDSFDVVARVNDVSPPEELLVDYGSRTDLLFESCDYRFVENSKKKLAQNLRITNGIKLVYIPGIKADHEWKLNVLELFREANEPYGLSFSWIGEENYQTIYDLVGTEPNSGLASVLVLLLHKVDELFVTGFTFYQNALGASINHHYSNFYLDNHEFAQSCDPQLGHAQQPQIDFFKNIILKQFPKSVMIDSVLRDILGVPDYSNSRRLPDGAICLLSGSVR